MQPSRWLACALAVGCAAAAAAAPARDSAIAARVQRVLAATPVIDGHNDLPWEIRTRYGGVADVDLARDTRTQRGKHQAPDAAPLMTDIPRLRAGHVGAQFWSVWVPPSEPGPKAVLMTLEQIDLVHGMVEKYPDAFALATSADEIERIERSGRIASLIGVEGGHQIDDSLAVLRDYYALGARYLTLTHWKNTAWADSANDAPAHRGLTPFGRQVVHEMNRLGMLVDLSHVSPDTMRAALQASAAPVIFSHSGARALDDNPRDVRDDVLALVRQNRGIVMVNFYPPFVSQQVNLWNADHAGAVARYAALYSGQPGRAKAALDDWERRHPQPRATLALVADHIEHIRKVAGIDSVGIGSDFDGIDTTPVGLDGVDKYPALFAELARRGWTDDALADLAGRNLLRVLRRAEQVARQLQAAGGPAYATPAPAAAGG